MTLDEAIKHCLEKAEENENCANKCEAVYGEDNGIIEACRECAAEHRQLADWLMELKEAKRLLKAAAEDIVWLNEHTVDSEGGCLIETATDTETCLACPLNVNNSHLCGWKHQVEALALIGGTDND